MHSPTNRHWLGFILSLNAAVLWGILPIAIKEVIASMDGVSIVWYRFLIAGLVLFCYLGLKRRLPSITGKATSVYAMLLVAAIALCINYSLFSMSLNYVNAETAEAVIQLTTLFLILGGVFIYGEPFFALQKFGTLLLLAGLLLFFNNRIPQLLAVENVEQIGVIMVLFSAMAWTVYALIQKQLLLTYSSAQTLLLFYCISLLALFPFATPSSVFALSSTQFWLLLFCCANTVIAYGSFAEAMQHWEASKVSAVLALAPLITIASLKLVVFINPDYVHSDKLNTLALMGALVLVLGSVLIAIVPLLRGKQS